VCKIVTILAVAVSLAVAVEDKNLCFCEWIAEATNVSSEIVICMVDSLSHTEEALQDDVEASVLEKWAIDEVAHILGDE